MRTKNWPVFGDSRLKKYGIWGIQKKRDFRKKGEDLRIQFRFFRFFPQIFRIFQLVHSDEIVAILNHEAGDEGDDEELEEVYAGCERPGMPTLDTWKWVEKSRKI